MTSLTSTSTSTSNRGYRLNVVGCSVNGQPRTYRLAPSSAQAPAYRRLAAAILGLDVASLAVELRSARLSATTDAASASTSTLSELVQFPTADYVVRSA